MLDPSDVNDIPNLVGSGILEQSNGAVVQVGMVLTFPLLIFTYTVVSQVSGKMDAWKLKQIYNLVKVYRSLSIAALLISSLLFRPRQLAFLMNH